MSTRIERITLSAFLGLALLACPSKPADAQYTIRECNALWDQISAAMEESDAERWVSLARKRLTYCKHTMDTEEYVIVLDNLAVGLHRGGQYSEALAVANHCLQINSVHLGCMVDKAAALNRLNRLREAKATVDKGLTYPVITEFDVNRKKLLKTLLENINLKLQSQPERRQTTGYGSAFFVSDAGHIVTNSHVAKNCGSLTTANGTALKFVRSNNTIDLALLQAPSVKPGVVATFRQTDAIIGEPIVVFGFPLTGVLSTSGNLTTGTVSATSGMRDNSRNLQITAPVQPGNSGGPLLDQSGNVIGVVVAKLDAAKAASITGDIRKM